MIRLSCTDAEGATAAYNLTFGEVGLLLPLATRVTGTVEGSGRVEIRFLRRDGALFRYTDQREFVDAPGAFDIELVDAPSGVQVVPAEVNRE